MLQSGALVCAKYEVIRQIGRGGMSTVYEARDRMTGKALAIKDVERSGSENNQIVVQSLTTEGRMLKQLDNPHLPKIYDIIENDDSFMLVMDYIEGESLDRVIAKTGAKEPQLVYQWGMQICEVFDYLHHQEPPVIYRDMKPANVILQPNGNLMMIDFGTARTQKVGQVLQSDTVCIGTEGFAAPEQYGGVGESDARTDIFCLGGTLYNLVTGHSPSDIPKGILPLERWDLSLADSPLNSIIEKCTRRDPDERYQTAMELYEDLRLASTGGFRSPKKGKSGPLSGGLRKAAWQEQKVRTPGGATGGLSGLLGRTGISKKLEKAGDLNPAQQPQKAPANAEPPYKNSVSGTAWQVATPNVCESGQMTNQENRNPAWTHDQPEQEESARQGTPWQKVMLFSAIAAVVFALLGIVFLAADLTPVALMMLVFTIGALVLAVAGIAGVLRSK